MYTVHCTALRFLGYDVWVECSWVGLAGGAWVICRASEGEGRCAQSQSYEGYVESGGFCFQIEGFDDTNRKIVKLQRSSNQMLFVVRGSSYMTSEFGEVFWHSDFSEQLMSEIRDQCSKPSPIIITVIVMVIKIIIIDIVMVIGLQATLRGQSQVCRSWLYTNPPETIETIAHHLQLFGV